MATNMATTDAPFGFIPYGPVLRVQRYAVNTAPTINLCPGDLVAAGGAVVSTPKGYLMDVDDAAVPDGDPGILGSIISCEDEDGYPLAYIAPARVGNSTIAGYVMVADHPDQLYLAQEDGDTNAIDLAEGSQNANVLSASLCAPNTDTGRSTMQIDSTSAGTSGDLNVKLIQPYIDDIPADDDNPYCRWVCTIVEHFYGTATAGAAGL